MELPLDRRLRVRPLVNAVSALLLACARCSRKASGCTRNSYCSYVKVRTCTILFLP